MDGRESFGCLSDTGVVDSGDPLIAAWPHDGLNAVAIDVETDESPFSHANAPPFLLGRAFRKFATIAFADMLGVLGGRYADPWKICRFSSAASWPSNAPIAQRVAASYSRF